MRILAFASLVSVFAAVASADGYSNHRGVVLFQEAPCTDLIDTIDWLETAEPPNLLDEEQMQNFINSGASAALAFGILLGVDLERGGLHAEGQTTLQRLRKKCAQSPQKSAKQILDGF